MEGLIAEAGLEVSSEPLDEHDQLYVLVDQAGNRRKVVEKKVRYILVI